MVNLGAMARKRLVLHPLRHLGGCMAGSRSSDIVVRFGAYELDQQAGELRKDGLRVRLQEQPLQILRLLLDQPGKIITREELHSAPSHSLHVMPSRITRNSHRP